MAKEKLIGYARCSTTRQDIEVQKKALLEFGVSKENIYMDKGLTGTKRDHPGLDQALAAAREGDTFVVTKLDRLARSVPDARCIADQLSEKKVKLAIGATIYDPKDPMGKMFFNMLATLAGFESDLIRMRTREGMAMAKANGAPKHSKNGNRAIMIIFPKTGKEPTRPHITGIEKMPTSRLLAESVIDDRNSLWQTNTTDYSRIY